MTVAISKPAINLRERLAALKNLNPNLNWDGVAITHKYAVGANPTAKLYPDGSIIGETDNGHYKYHPNGTLEMTLIVIGDATATTGSGTWTTPHKFVQDTTGAQITSHAYIVCNGVSAGAGARTSAKMTEGVVALRAETTAIPWSATFAGVEASGNRHIRIIYKGKWK